MDTREKIARRVHLLRGGRKGRRSTDLSWFRRGVRRELRELVDQLERHAQAVTVWLSLASAMRQEGFVDGARVAVGYARRARLIEQDLRTPAADRANAMRRDGQHRVLANR